MKRARQHTGVMTPPAVSMPRERGHTSSSTTCLRFSACWPHNTAAWTAAPERYTTGNKKRRRVKDENQQRIREKQKLQRTHIPKATASSGLTVLLGSFPLKNSLTNCWTLGIRVEPPTKMTSSIWSLLIFASFRTFSTGGMV